MRILVCAFVFGCALAIDNGLGLRPQMGWNSWYDLMDTLNEENIRATADAMVRLGLNKLGYTYINLDDCWAEGRYINGSVYAEASKFPSKSLKPLADYVHSLGLKFGTYTDRGTKTCAGRPGSQDYEDIDAQTYASWGIDYVKEDSCYASTDHQVAFTQYGKMRDALNKTGRPIFFSLCGWEEWYAPMGWSLGNSWRIGPDDTNWAGVLQNVNINANLGQYARPGGWNDPCLLLAETYTGELRMTQRQTRTQFNFWAVMASPLLISANIRNMSAENLETYMNAEVIAIDQDPLGIQGKRLIGGNLAPASDSKVMNAPLPPGAKTSPHKLSKNDDPLSIVACNASDMTQQWSLDSPATGYIQNHASKECFNVDNCDYDIIMFECVTTGGTCCGPNCYYNMQFQLTPNGTLTSPIHPGYCVDTNSSGTFSMTPCTSPITDSQYFAYDSARSLLKAGRSGDRCVSTVSGGINVWGRKITGGYAVLFINAGSYDVDITCDRQCFADMGFAPGLQLNARDVWLHQSFVASSDGYVAKQVPSDGGSIMIIFSQA